MGERETQKQETETEREDAHAHTQKKIIIKTLNIYTKKNWVKGADIHRGTKFVVLATLFSLSFSLVLRTSGVRRRRRRRRRTTTTVL